MPSRPVDRPSEDSAAAVPGAAGKGRPTPKRSQAQGQRRGGPVPPPPRTRKEAAQRAREEAEMASRTPERLQAIIDAATADHGKEGPKSVARAAEAAREEWVRTRLVEYGRTRAQSLGWTDIYTFTKALGQQLAPKGIRVNAVAPGPIWTPLQPSGGQKSEDLPEFGQSTPLGRAGQPTELAPAYVFLASPESSYVVGATIPVTGGMPTP